MLYLFLLALGVFGSTNKDLYTCDMEAQPGYCVFVSTTPGEDLVGNTVPDDFADMMEFNAIVTNGEGTQLSVSPQPWSEGDQIVKTVDSATENDWGFALAFAMVAPLRNKMMFAPSELADESEWLKYTKAFTDCHIKMEDAEVVTGSGGTAIAFGTDGVYEQFLNPSGGINTVLQYLEEAAVELVCMMTDLTMYTGCATTRSYWEYDGETVTEATQCDCWIDAYRGIFGQEPNVMGEQFKECTLAGEDTGTDSGSDSTDTDDSSTDTDDGSTDTDNTNGDSGDDSTDTPEPPVLPPTPTIRKKPGAQRENEAEVGLYNNVYDKLWKVNEDTLNNLDYMDQMMNDDGNAQESKAKTATSLAILEQNGYFVLAMALVGAISLLKLAFDSITRKNDTYETIVTPEIV